MSESPASQGGIKIYPAVEAISGGLRSSDAPLTYHFKASGENARSVLIRALMTVGTNYGKLTWILNYGPREHAYALNVIPVREFDVAPAAEPLQRAAKPGGSSGIGNAVR